MSALCRRTMNVEALPPATIFSMFGRPLLLINSAEYLQDIYVNKNQFVDKDYGRGHESEPVLGESIFFASSHDPKTHERRKALSGAFFKSKLLPMTKVIREVTLKVIKNWQKDGDREINLADLTEELQSKIIITVLIGAEYQDHIMEHEDDNGKLEKIHIAKFLIKILIYTVDRFTQPVMVLFPELISKIFTSADRRWKRNIDRYEAFVEEIGKKREATGVEGTDLLSILNSFSEYKGDYRKIAHELGVFLFAGMRTIQFTTINTVYYLTKHTAFFDKLMAEITPVLE
jgi:cytochrome P450